MKEHIVDVIHQIEIDHDVKILFACESGSRAWGFHSKDSDYDVRFIYIHKPDWYLSIDQKRDVIEIPARDSVSIPIEPLLDISGWELTKALRLFRKSNPPLLEWLQSTIVYYQSYTTIDQMEELEQKTFSPVSCMHHYVSMAKGNFRDLVQGEDVMVKKYLNVLRPLLAAKWIEKYDSIPPIEFQELFEELWLEGEWKDSIGNLLKQKREGEEIYLEPRLDALNEHLQKEIEHIEAYAKSIKKDIPDPTGELDMLFRGALREVWDEEWKELGQRGW
ncbi:nucleotidyltransferase domain-containing protein [Rossellomorea sp. KS-H15a]|uniref:nucleotidyltransferase domain-containing protein n=1 Tax=Rossellomorea sp. KS-H15a TaxID=2963940 RepID=UPI0020C5E064|nr:nucleotidyltransferase domain-containing protein [Rossellomorea sp. KS-H15a]UTE76836.1 nucleotidyltransferase domain-containing protein [Rossellomorea sp. KS-H15a]